MYRLSFISMKPQSYLVPCVSKVTHPGLLKISGLQEGVYTFQMTVTDMAGQKSSDNVSVTVLPPKHQAEGEVNAPVLKLTWS